MNDRPFVVEGPMRSSPSTGIAYCIYVHITKKPSVKDPLLVVECDLVFECLWVLFKTKQSPVG